ncbi:MAG: cytochrome d ubiquinol oxidase subunit II [Thiovulaceae bacterium]|nr:cytochrome d ubiquinol oxidase subunit II [Sulfurimonadaceae bacterium]
MFENLSLLALQEYWWIIVSLLGGLFVFMMFVQGGQTLVYTLGRTEVERDVLINSLGRKWELTFTTLVLFGGALFAAFPLFYAVSFGGAYFVWMGILFSFIIQAVSYEYRKKPNNIFGAKTYELFLYINGALGVLLIGTAVGTFFTGGNFVVNEMHLSSWTNRAYGLEAVLNPFNVIFGFMLFFLSRMQGTLYFINNIHEDIIVKRAKVTLKVHTLLFLIAFIFVALFLVSTDGFALNSVTKIVSIEPHKYLHNLIAMPLVSGMILLGAVLLLFGVFIALFKESKKGIWFSGLGTVLVGMGLFLLVGLGDTAYYPSLHDLQSSLTIANSSSSRFTLTTMSYVSLMVPFVLAYIVWAWRALDKEKITIAEVQSDPHHY